MIKGAFIRRGGGSESLRGRTGLCERALFHGAPSSLVLAFSRFSCSCISMATAVLSAQDCLVRYPPREEHGISRRRSQFLQTGAASGEVSAHFFPSYNTSGYVSPRKVQLQVKGNPLSRHSVVASSPPDQKRSSKSKAPDDYQPEVLRKNVNSDGRIYIKSSRNNNNVEAPKKGSMDDRCKGGSRSLVMGQVTILKRGQTVKGISKGVKQLAPVGGGLGILGSVSDAGDVSQQFVTDGENYVKGVANYPDFHVLNSEKWAGPAFVNSPSPSSLPFPKFSVKKPVQVDSSATRDLRRLLGLD